jgi:branched-chain amino acid aminotransferase
MNTNDMPDVWINGEFVPFDNASIHPLCHSLQRGSTLFESMDCCKTHMGTPAIFRMREHLERFSRSADIIGCELPYTVDELSEAIVETVKRSGLTDCTIRPLAIYDMPEFDVFPQNTHVSVILGVAESHDPPETLDLKISSFRKIDTRSMPVKAKVSGNYINPMLAKHEAILEGYDDAALLDSEEYVAEGTTASIFIVESGKLVTAPDDTVLLGITRDSVITVAGALEIPLALERYDVARLKNADEVILCSSGKYVAPVTKIDRTIIGDGGMGPVTKQLQDYYMDIITGRNERFRNWLTYVK